MKKIIILIIVNTVAIFNILSEVNIDKIGVINIDQVMSTVFTETSNIYKDIKQEEENLKNKLAQMKENIMKLEAAKLNEKDASKRLEYDKKIDASKKEYADYYKIRIYQIQKKKENSLGTVLEEVRIAVTKVAEKEGYSLILDINSKDIFYYSIDIEITQKVIDYLTKEKK